MDELVESLGDILEDFEMEVSDEKVEQSHEIIQLLNQKYQHKIKLPVGFGVKAS